MTGPRLAGALAGVLAGAVWTVGATQVEAPPGVATSPRLVVAVFSAAGPADRVMLLFDHQVPREAVKERVARLGELCGSRVEEPEVAYAPFVSLWEADNSREAGGEPKAPVIQTTVRFAVGGLTDWKRGTLAVAPFAQAFHRDLPLRIVYHVGADFAFTGPTSFRADGVVVRHLPSATSQRYDVIPRPAAAKPPRATGSRSEVTVARRWTGVMVGMTAAIAVTVMVLIGLIAYGWYTQADRGAGRRKRKPGGAVVTVDGSDNQQESERERG